MARALAESADFGTSSIGEHVGSLKGQAEITDVKEVPLRQSDMKRELNYSGDLMRQQNPLNPSSHLPMAVALTSDAFFFYSNFKFPANDRVFVTGKLTNHLTFFCSSRRGQKKKRRRRRRGGRISTSCYGNSRLPFHATRHGDARQGPVLSFNDIIVRREKGGGRRQFSNTNASLSPM